MNEFREEYIEEAKKLLKDLEQVLLLLETNQGDGNSINTAYRLLHTLKGSAGMFGFSAVEKLAHELEHLFSDVRDGLRQVDEYLIDLTLHSIDIFTDLINGVDSQRAVDKIIFDIATLKRERADALVQGETLVTKKETEQQLGYIIWLTPHRNIFKRGVNFNAVVQEIVELGISKIFIHEETIPFDKQIANKEVTSRLEILLLTTQNISVIGDVFMFLQEKEFDIIPFTDDSVFASVTYTKFKTLTSAEALDRTSFFSQSIDQNPIASTSENQNVVRAQQPLQRQEEENHDSKLTGTEKQKTKNSHVNVSTAKLDHLINVVSELVIFRSELSHLLADAKNPAVEEALEKLERLTVSLRDSSFNIRLVPLSVLSVKFQRLIRSVSKELGKEIEFITEGLDTELDRSMITALEGPIIHLIRNAIDHGIENPEMRLEKKKPKKGLLKLYSYNSGDHVFIQIQDDGAGIDFDKVKAKGIERGILQKNQNYSEKELVNVMMMPGFSTADKITTVSGRGVGMDAVKKDITALRGEIEISTEKGLGSIFTIRLPLTMTILDTLVVDVSNSKFLIPLNEIECCFKQQHDTLFRKNSRQIVHDGQLVPFVSLREYFGIQDFPANETVIVINKNDTRVAVVVDSIVGELQTVYKPLNELLQSADCFSGASIMGDGSMALILNALKLQN